MHAIRSLYRIPLAFFALAACFGLLLRWHVVSPMDWMHYPYWLHAHSHLMFLGWVTNVLLIFMAEGFIPEAKVSSYRKRFFWLQILLAGMAVSFPLKGYGVASIVLSTLHTALIVVFAFRFFRDTRKSTETTSLWYVRIALIYFLVSAAGPIAIGATSAMGPDQSKWYYFSVYYYLHFQYNGFFTFGVLAVVIKMLEGRSVPFSQVAARRSGQFLAVACVPAYFLSTLWADPGWVFNAIGFLAGTLQIISLVLLLKSVRSASPSIASGIQPMSAWLLVVALISYVVKVLAQWLSAFPEVAHLAAANRPFVMAYLHLVLIGTISLPLLSWYLERSFFRRFSHAALIILLAGFLHTEVLLMLMPVAPRMGFSGNLAIPMLAASLILAVGVVFLPFCSRKS